MSEFEASAALMRYKVVFEGNDEVGYSAYLPELPGCVSAGETFDETKTLIAEAVGVHLELMEEEGLPIPEPAPMSPELVIEVSASPEISDAALSNPKRTFQIRFVSA